MNKLKMISLNKVDDNVGKIGKRFPNCLTERIVGCKKMPTRIAAVLPQSLNSFLLHTH